MMWNISLLLAIGCICVASQRTTVSPRDREICERINTRCLRNQGRLGNTNDVTTIFNNHCRGITRNWRDVSRCQLADATCQLTLLRCRSLSCSNVRGVVQSGTNPGPRTTRSTRTTRPTRTTRSTRTTRPVRTTRPTRTTRSTRTTRPTRTTRSTRTTRPTRTTRSTRTTRPTRTTRTPRPGRTTRRPLPPTEPID